MKIKTSELQGTALDWAVAKCDGRTIQRDPMEFGITTSEGGYWVWETQPFYYAKIGRSYTPSTDWAQGGPIIEREGVQLARVGDVWEAWVDADGVFCQGPTPLTAAMRCFVSSRLGDEVEIPEELQGETK